MIKKLLFFEKNLCQPIEWQFYLFHLEFQVYGILNFYTIYICNFDNFDVEMISHM